MWFVSLGAGILSEAKPVYVILMGGLGNQLFQMAAALNFSSGGPIHVDWKTASPRLNEKGLPEITSFNLPSNIVFLENKKANFIERKTFAFLLRLGVDDKRFRRMKFLVGIFKFIGSTIYTLRFRRPVRIAISQGLGFSTLKDGYLSRVLVGYFQSYFWTENSAVMSELQSLHSVEKNDQFQELKKYSEIESPLVVHLRSGDYRNESAFGMLKREYYSDSIKFALANQKFGAIWVFSDEIDYARSVINFDIGLPVRFIEEFGRSTSINFDAMRLGHGYVIANSSFSWWAARLSFSRPKIVVAPEPWFIGLTDFPGLIPPSWLRHNGHE
jgi:hypothetical protein